jgi:hypothetical protein
VVGLAAHATDRVQTTADADPNHVSNIKWDS